jgi:hypothetical protein
MFIMGLSVPCALRSALCALCSVLSATDAPSSVSTFGLSYYLPCSLAPS